MRGIIAACFHYSIILHCIAAWKCTYWNRKEGLTVLFFNYYYFIFFHQNTSYWESEHLGCCFWDRLVQLSRFSHTGHLENPFMQKGHSQPFEINSLSWERSAFFLNSSFFFFNKEHWFVLACQRDNQRKDFTFY